MYLTESEIRDIIRRRVILEEIKPLTRKSINEQQQPSSGQQSQSAPSTGQQSQSAPGTVPSPAANTLDPKTLAEIDIFINIANNFSGGNSPSGLANFAQSIGGTGTFFAGLGATTIAGVAGTLWGGFYGGLASAALAGAIGGISYAAISKWTGGSATALKDINDLLSHSTNLNSVKREVEGLFNQINNKKIVMPGCKSSTTPASTSGSGSPATFSMFIDPNDVLNPQDFLSIPLGSVRHTPLAGKELQRIAKNILDEIHKAADESFGSGNANVMKNIIKQLSGNGITLYDLHIIDMNVGAMIRKGAYTKLQFKEDTVLGTVLTLGNTTTDFAITKAEFDSHYDSKSTSNIIYLLSNMVDVKGNRIYDDDELASELSGLPIEAMKQNGIFSLNSNLGSAMQCYVNKSGGTSSHYQVHSSGSVIRTNIGQAFFESIALTVNQKIANAWNGLVRVFNSAIAFAKSAGSTALTIGLKTASAAMSGIQSLYSQASNFVSGTGVGQWLSSVFGQIGQIITGTLGVVVAILNAIKNFFTGGSNKQAAGTGSKAAGAGKSTSSSQTGTSSSQTGTSSTNQQQSGQRTQQQAARGAQSSLAQSSGGYIKVNLTGDPSVRSLTDVGYAQGSTSALYDDLYSKAPRNYVGSEDLNFKVKTELGSPGNRRVTVRLARGERRRAMRGLEGVQNAIKNFLRNVQISDPAKFGKIPSQRRGSSDMKEFELVVKLGSKR